MVGRRACQNSVWFRVKDDDEDRNDNGICGMMIAMNVTELIAMATDMLSSIAGWIRVMLRIIVG